METKKKEINLEDSLISLFYSVLMFLKEKFHFNVVTHINYPLLENSKITAMINTGKGTKFLRSIRKNYFKDELVFLWKVLYIFFDKSEKIASGRYHQEKLLIRNFNNVFEDMIDRLLSNSEKKVPPRLKEQLDGKIVDHIYSDESLTGPEKIYFIGDSKYYQERHSVGLPSIYKQFTYAKNIIQFNVGILDGTALLDKSIRYRDSLTEGYNITPNFFIRGTVNFERMNGKEDNLENINETHLISQFGDRLFDRDTLLLQTYSINFLYVMESYIARGNNESFRKKAKAAFREDILKRLNEKYTFYQVECKSDEQVCSFVNKYFRKLIGKMFRVSESSTDILLAFEKGQQEENDIIQDLKEKEWSVNEIVIPISTPEKE